jgi:hypothetical protein
MTIQSARLHHYDAVIAEREHGDDMPQAILQEWPDLAYPPLRSMYDCEGCGTEVEVGQVCAICATSDRLLDGTLVYSLEKEVEYLLGRGQMFGPWVAYPTLPVSEPHTFTFDLVNNKMCRDEKSIWAAHAYFSRDGWVCVNTHGIAPAAVEERFRSIGLRWNAAWSWWEMMLTAECVGRLKGALEFAGAGASNGLLVRMEIMG